MSMILQPPLSGATTSAIFWRRPPSAIPSPINRPAGETKKGAAPGKSWIAGAVKIGGTKKWT
jgi:hypothetical protein